MNIEDIKKYFDNGGYTYALNKPASEFTTFRTGGACDTVLYPQSIEALTISIGILKTAREKFCVIGAGSNVLFPDEGYRGTVVMTGGVRAYRINQNTVYAECGVPLIQLCRAVCEAELTGLEFAYGIPGSLGGAVYMNAGAYDGELKNVAKSVTYYDASDGGIKTVGADECAFGYRTSVFQSTGALILSAELVLEYGDKGKIYEKMNELMNRRREKQPLNYPSAGSVFKRYPGRYTAAMIDASGLKGCTIGGAQVSEKHAGFIVNRGGATSTDIKTLICHVQRVIRQTEGIDIECEIRFIE